jgi:hypothetical protein
VKKANLKVLVLLIVGIIISGSAEAQRWGGQKKPGFWDDWSINGSAGLTSFFGDLSLYDSDIASKLSEESGPGFSGVLTKYLKDQRIGLAGQLLYGGFKGENTNGTNFEASIFEFNFQLRLQLINLISPYNISKFGLEAYGGIGQFLFKATKWVEVEGEMDSYVNDTGVPEFVYFGGAAMSYEVMKNLSLTLDMSLRQAQNDMLDVESKNGDSDYYSYISFGVTYHIDSFKKSSFNTRGGNTRGRMSGRLPMRRRR